MGKISNSDQGDKLMTKIKWVKNQCAVFLILALAILGCAGKEKSVHRAQALIIAELELKAREINSYAQDYRINGLLVKRMYFQFEKNGLPFYRFREDLIRAGKRYVYIYNADGKHDYHYFPDGKKAYRCPTNNAWNETNYEKAKDWHYSYKDARIIGEEVFLGKECILLEMQNSIFAVGKEKGIKLAKMNLEKDKKNAMVYENVEFDLSDDVFGIPPDVSVIDRKECN